MGLVPAQQRVAELLERAITWFEKLHVLRPPQGVQREEIPSTKRFFCRLMSVPCAGGKGFGDYGMKLLG